jgi:hypothetical protein
LTDIGENQNESHAKFFMDYLSLTFEAIVTSNTSKQCVPTTGEEITQASVRNVP